MTDIITYNIHANHVHPTTEMGKNVYIGPGCSIGGDGFWFPRNRKTGETEEKESFGKVIIEDNVVLQAGVCIDRGMEEDGVTIIGEGTKIDNLVHIAHDCHIGKHNRITAGTIFGGCVTMGDKNFIGLNATIHPNVVIGDKNKIGMGSVIIPNKKKSNPNDKDIESYEVWAGNPAKFLRVDDFWEMPTELKHEIEWKRHKENNARPKTKPFTTSIESDFLDQLLKYVNEMEPITWKIEPGFDRKYVLRLVLKK